MSGTHRIATFSELTWQRSRAQKSAPIPRQSLSAAVTERLHEKILGGELREGERLRQDAIAPSRT